MDRILYVLHEKPRARGEARLAKDRHRSASLLHDRGVPRVDANAPCAVSQQRQTRPIKVDSVEETSALPNEVFIRLPDISRCSLTGLMPAFISLHGIFGMLHEGTPLFLLRVRWRPPTMRAHLCNIWQPDRIMKISDTLASNVCRSIKQTRQIHCNGATARWRSIVRVRFATSRSRFFPRRSKASATPSPPPFSPLRSSDSSSAIPDAEPSFPPAGDTLSCCFRRAILITECIACSFKGKIHLFQSRLYMSWEDK